MTAQLLYSLSMSSNSSSAVAKQSLTIITKDETTDSHHWQTAINSYC